MIEALQSFEAGILLFVQQHIRFAALDYIMWFFSVISNAGACWIALGLVLFARKKTRRAGFDLLLALAFAWIINNLILKNAVARPRPWTVIEELEIIVAPLKSYSFPSGHTCSSFAAATTLFLAFRGKGGGYAFLPAILISLSRIYVGVHYPSDVLAGAVIGAACALLAYRLGKKCPWPAGLAE